MKALHFLREQGFKHVKNVRGGILAWADEIDPKVAKSKALAAVDYVRSHYSDASMIGVLRQILPIVSISKAA